MEPASITISQPLQLEPASITMFSQVEPASIAISQSLQLELDSKAISQLLEPASIRVLPARNQLVSEFSQPRTS